ncbi:MAG TPA: thioredoxin family protein [Pyrinomonadaceae bacterium]|nr:thioredoxin family protein [Pyrinomonadaceae bacterium]
MKRVSILFSILLLVFVLTVSNARAGEFTIGSTVENFKLSDINGVEKSFNELKGEKGTMVVFLSAQCPVVKGYNDRLNAVVADYKAKGINFIGINSNATESLTWVKSHAEENYKFPMLIDTGNVIADKFGAVSTPEVFFFDKDNKLAYHGAIDNDKSGSNITSPYLRVALDEYLSGKAISKNSTKAFGCTIKRKE